MLRLSTFTADEWLRTGVRTGTQIHLDRLSVAPLAVNLPSAARAKKAEGTDPSESGGDRPFGSGGVLRTSMAWGFTDQWDASVNDPTRATVYDGEMEGDHVVPWSKGGKTVPENLQMLCRRCNALKSDKF